MRTETRTVRIGERVRDVDWGYDFYRISWDRDGSMNPDCIPRRIEMLRVLDDAFKNGLPYEATTDGGMPRCGWGRVLDVGMYDGWPNWTPTPAVYIQSWMGGSWHSWYALSDIRIATPTTGGGDK